MSKLYGFLFLSLMIQYSQQDEAIKAKLREVNAECQKLHIRTQREVINLNQYHPTDAVKNYFKCFAKAMNLVTPEGAPIPENVNNFLKGIDFPPKHLESTMKNCVKPSDPLIDTAFHMLTCILKVIDRVIKNGT